jgi:ABC-type multidrug transport system ATPase subunit
MQSSDPIALELREVVIRYGFRATIGPVSVCLPAGGVLGLMGANGSGKTSLMRAICALQPVHAGRVEALGRAVEPGVPVAGIGAMIEEPRFYPWLSARDNLQLAAGGRRDWQQRIPTALETVELSHVANVRVDQFSQGMRQRLGLARARLGEPRILVLDEPTNGLDVGGIALMRRLLASLVADGTTLVLSSHVLSEVQHLATVVLALRAGDVVASGHTSELVATWGSLEEMYAETVGL